MATKLRLNNVRISFADDIFHARAPDDGDGEPKFNGEVILAPDHIDVKKLDAAIDKEGKEFFGSKWAALKSKLETENRLCLRKTPRTNQSGEVYDGYEGMYWVRASSKRRPLILNANKEPISQADGIIYSGCFVNLVIEVFGHTHKKGGNRVLAQLKGVQYNGPGDAFGGGAPASSDDFDEVEVAEEDLA